MPQVTAREYERRLAEHAAFVAAKQWWERFVYERTEEALRQVVRWSHVYDSLKRAKERR